MEAYLRLGLLLIAVSIVFLIVLESWYRKRQMDIRNDQRPGQRILDPDEILGLQPVDDIFAEAQRQMQMLLPTIRHSRGYKKVKIAVLHF